MRTLKTSEAALLLNVSPNTLRAWERRFGYPKPQRSAGRHRMYTHGEVSAHEDATVLPMRGYEEIEHRTVGW